MSSLFKYSTVLQIIKACEHCHRLKREKKKMFKNNVDDAACERLKKKTKLTEKEGIKALFRSQMHFMIQNIEKTALLSEYVNLLVTEMEPETADQEMQDFEMQIDLAEREQQKPFSEKAVKRDFEMIIISDEKKKKEKKNEK
ncbi:uncharacterized protein BDCG_16656 [Blastomyces dermatitidis ER-3]|uniref:Uncharacterized protein n=1 Tax=Ajellomyces dermatitidis (strain ER-3 / ATCC MYA-2586) TaxID=559297 RepID=A0ABX2VTL3_AJEDR|nr:uncharacterized protein BDCG_16656 [Blastomyces dermatitidis ER-3]OAT00530.1 hypothetical protein BDCG_16656 [Blastomyces dermatitidis ER-3]